MFGKNRILSPRPFSTSGIFDKAVESFYWKPTAFDLFGFRKFRPCEVHPFATKSSEGRIRIFKRSKLRTLQDLNLKEVDGEILEAKKILYHCERVDITIASL